MLTLFGQAMEFLFDDSIVSWESSSSTLVKGHQSKVGFHRKVHNLPGKGTCAAHFS